MGKSLGIVLKPDSNQAVALAKKIIKWAEGNNVVVKTDMSSSSQLDLSIEKLPLQQLVQASDFVVSLGGDGTFIRTARLVTENRRPVFIGIKFGNLGFLTEIMQDDVFEQLDDLLNNKGEFGYRSMLNVAVEDKEGNIIFTAPALNDVVVQKGAREGLLPLAIKADGDPVCYIRSDGLIISTPTGSTAYSLAAGGSIVFPSLQVTLLTPICPHSLTIRPLILPAEMEINLNVHITKGDIYLSVDGQEFYTIKEGDTIKVTRSSKEVCFLKSKRFSYFDILREKLHWGRSNQE